MTILETTSIISDFVLVLTLITVAVYAWLTLGLKKISNQQLKLSLMPLPVVYLKGRDSRGRLETFFRVKNIGSAPALNIEFEEFNLHFKDNLAGRNIDENYKYILKMTNPNVLDKGEERELLSESFKNDQPMGSGFSLSTYLDPRFSDMEIPLTLKYQDITGRSYSIKIGFGSAKLKIIKFPKEIK